MKEDDAPITRVEYLKIVRIWWLCQHVQVPALALSQVKTHSITGWIYVIQINEFRAHQQNKYDHIFVIV